MAEKRVFYSEAAYVLGVILLGFGTALMEKADLGVSMVVAPAYLIYRAVSQAYPFFTFGMAEYSFQAFLLIALSVALRRGRKSYLFSFVTAVIYGCALDLFMRLIAGVPTDTLGWRLLYYFTGLVICSAGVACYFHTYVTPAAYELTVKEISEAYGFRIDKVKTIYDLCSCFAGVVLSFLFFGFGHFEGVKFGTLFCALVNGWLIGRIGAWMERTFRFEDRWALREMFSK